MRNFRFATFLASLGIKSTHFFILTTLLIVIAFWGGLSELVVRWDKQPEYGHGYFIPLISLWFLWHRRSALIASWSYGLFSGFFLVLLGLLVLVLGEISAIYILIQYGFLITLAGITLASGGKHLLKVAFVPILILLFAIPLPYFVDAQLSWKLQILSSQIGVGILRLFGTSVFLEGNVIDLGLYKLQVVDACSGLRYLYPLLSIGFLIGYMYRGQFWQRMAIFLSTIPITIFMNSFRISVVGWLVNQWGNEMADGFLHYFEGWIVFIACLLIMLTEIKLFEAFSQKRSLAYAIDVPVVYVDGSNIIKSQQVSYPQIFSILVIIAAVFFVYSFNEREEIKPAKLPLSAFPMTLDAWKGVESSLDSKVETALAVDDYLLANYALPVSGNQQDSQVNFYVAYYNSQRKGASPHSPQVCMPGGGWVITSLQDVKINLPEENAFVVNRAIIERGNSKQIVYYWFDQRGRRIANEYAMKWYLLIDGILKNRTDGAMVRVTTLVQSSETLESADQRLVYFLQTATPKLKQYVPE